VVGGLWLGVTVPWSAKAAWVAKRRRLLKYWGMVTFFDLLSAAGRQVSSHVALMPFSESSNINVPQR
jgi:hypothetical protein